MVQGEGRVLLPTAHHTNQECDGLDRLRDILYGDTEQGNVPPLRSKELADEIDRGNLQHKEEDGTYIPTITLLEVLEVRRIEVLRGAKRRDPPTVRERSEDFLCLDLDDPMQRRGSPRYRLRGGLTAGGTGESQD